MTAYFRPATLDEALAIRAGREVEIIAGGTDVYPNKTTRAGWGRMAHKDVLDVTAIPGLRRIEEVDGHWRIGALATWTDVIRAAGRVAIAVEEALERLEAGSARARDLDLGIERQEIGDAVAGRRGGAQVSDERRAILDLLSADFPGRRAQPLE